MIDINSLDVNSILSEEVFNELFNIEMRSEQARMKMRLQDRAKILGVKTRWDELYKSYRRDLKAANYDLVGNDGRGNLTKFDFSDLPDGAPELENMWCGAWEADMKKGIIMRTNDNMKEALACFHPILPVKRLINQESQEERIEVAFYRNRSWHFRTVARSVVASAQKIVSLASVGVGVTSESARALVRYLSDVEAANEIPVEVSSGKLGWHRSPSGKTIFLPYDEDQIHFDSSFDFKDLYESIGPHGDSERWLAIAKRVRARNRLEARVLLAASFASVLVSRLDILPFFVDLWGETEGGKTVALMLAASVWGDPADSKYIGDFKTTDTALEVKADLLNHLPMFLDDTSKTSARVRDNFESIIYDLCSGKGKSRSNRALGTRRENKWKNVFICNGERPLNSYANQGGALNRIIEVECEPEIFEDPRAVAETVKANYGHAGFDFVSALTVFDPQIVKETFDAYREELISTDGMQKQAMSLAAILTADAIATDFIFQDGRELKVEDVKKYLQTRAAVSDNERCYQYVIESALANPSRFDDEARIEQWGLLKDDFVFLLPKALGTICEEGGFNRSAFLSWAYAHGILDTDAGNRRNQKTWRYRGRPTKMYAIALGHEPEEDADDTEEESKPFKPYEGEEPDFS